MKLGLILALTRQGVIGRNNALPWQLPTDLKRFRELTLGHSIIMGRRTFESIGRPLPKRRNIVVSQDKSLETAGILVVPNLDSAIEICARAGEETAYIIGGAQLAMSAIDQITFAKLTWVESEISGDVVFPKTDWSDFQSVSQSHGEENGIRYCFEDFVRL